MDDHKLYWHLDRVLEWQKNRIIPPIYLEVSPVSYCNHRCIFCGLDFAMKKRRKLDGDVFCERLREMGGSVRSILYAGEGEPLLHEDLPQFIRETRTNHIDAAVATNGSVGHYSLWKELLPFLSWLRFSVDAASQATYARVHNVRETEFEKTLRSIADAVRVKRDYHLRSAIGVQFLLIQENMGEVERAIELFPATGIDYLVFKPYSRHPQMVKEKESVYDKAQIRYLQDVISRQREGSGCEISVRFHSLRKYMAGEKSYSHCYALPFWGYIASDGAYYTCSVFMKQERFEAGNLYERGMNDIFTGSRRRRSIDYGEKELDISQCRINCRMARINEFLELLHNEPEHVNFI